MDGRQPSPRFDIADRTIGPNFPPLVIAEVGINHEGDVNKALRLIDAIWTHIERISSDPSNATMFVTLELQLTQTYGLIQ